LVLKFKSESEYTEYSRETEYSFVIYRASQIGIFINQIFLNLTKYK
jgi:hypothetical protein